MVGKKKKRFRPPVADTVKTDADRNKVIDALLDAFSLASIHEVVSAYKEADGDANKAAILLATALDNASSSSSSNIADDSSSMSSGSCGSYGMDSSSTSSEGFKELMLASQFKGNGKKLVASTGTVSSILGKDYVTTNCKKTGGGKGKGFNNESCVVDREEAEQFLCSMLGDEPGLSLAVVRDVLCCYAYDVEKAMDALLRMCGSVDVQTYESSYNRLVTNDEYYTGLSSYYTSQPLEKEDNYTDRSYVDVLASSSSDFPASEKSKDVELPQAVLNSLFKVKKSHGLDPHMMNWHSVVKKLESIGKIYEASEVQSKEPAKGNEYQFYRKSASEYWDSTKSYYQKAASAYSTGERSYAAYLSDQGKLQKKIACEADEKASQQIFQARNKDIGNVITIDLHGQHVKQAMKLLKLHLLFGSYACSIQTIRVITGSGIHGLGKSMIKQSVIKLMERENIQWSEENSGTVIIRLNGQRNFRFVDSGSEPED